MRLLLVDNLVMPEEGSLAFLDVHPHLGLLALAAVAQADGHQVRIYDPKRLIRNGDLPYDETLYQRVANELLAMRPQVVGFTALGCSFLFAVNVAALLKRHEPDLPILLGGPHATMLHRQVLERFAQFDIVVRHEADEILPAVLDLIDQRRFDLIPGISWRASSGDSSLRFTEGKPKVEDLDRLPIASYDYYPVEKLGLSLLRIEAGRGCPFACTFCSTAGFFQRSFRLKSAERLVKELDILHARYGYSEFKLDHDMFTVNRRKVLEFCEAVSGRGYHWRVSARVDCVDKELLKKMADAGCVSLYFGIETGSRRMQKICRKRLDLQLVEPTLDATESLEIETTASFITGYPEETEQDQDDTLDMLGRCARRASCLPQLHILAPEPGTPMFDEIGSRIRYDGYCGPYNAGLLGPADEGVVIDHPDIFQTYYHYPGVLPRSRHIFAVEAVDLMRRVGPLVLAYTLCAFDGKLSRLVSEFRQFADATNSGKRPDAPALEAFVARKFGAGHHLVSLFRYGLRLHSATGSAGVMKQGAFDPDRVCTVSPDVQVLEEMHDCAVLIERILAQKDGCAMLGDDDVGELGAYIIKGGGEGAISYRADSGICAILGLFASPRSCRFVAEYVARATGMSSVDWSLFEALLHRGILAGVSDMSRPSAEFERFALAATQA